jgi:hypothetical protein
MIDNVLQPRIQEVENRIKGEFRKFIDEKQCSPKISKSRGEHLDRQIGINFF